MKRKRRHLYHNVLRSTAALAASVVFVSSLSTAAVTERTYESTALLANVVGLFVGVEPNPDNTKAAALAAKEQELVAREAALQEAGQPEKTGYELMSLVALALSSLVLLLVALNFYFDHLRALEERRGPLAKT